MAKDVIKRNKGAFGYYNPAPYVNSPGEMTFERSDCDYMVTDNFLFLTGRFHLLTTNLGNASIAIPYPSGITARNAGVGTVGYVGITRNQPVMSLSIRANAANECFIQYGAGNHSLPAIPADTWVMYFALIPR